MSKLIEVAEDAFELIVRILVPRSFVGLKVRLTGLLSGVLIAEIGIRIEAQYQGIEETARLLFELSGPDLGMFIAFATAVLFLVTQDWILYWRKQNNFKELMDLVRDPNLTAREKELLLDLLSEMSRELDANRAHLLPGGEEKGHLL